MTKFICDSCGCPDYSILYPARGSFTNTYLITDRSYGQHLQIVTCLKCGLVQAFPQITPKQTVSRYQSFVDPEYEREAVNRSRNCDRVLSQLEKYCPPGRLLDVGCATGLLVERAKARGWQAEGIEPSKWAAQIGQSKGLTIYQGTLDSVKLKAASFDAITCIDVIEHVNSPHTLLRQLASLLKPGGMLAIVTPNIHSRLAKVMGEKWWHIRPDHFYYFSPATLTALCLLTGFIKKSQSPYPWTFSLSYWLSRVSIILPLASWPITIDFHDSLLACFERPAC